MNSHSDTGADADAVVIGAGVIGASVAYELSTGNLKGVARFDGDLSGDDAASAIAVSPDGLQVFVTGASKRAIQIPFGPAFFDEGVHRGAVSPTQTGPLALDPDGVATRPGAERGELLDLGISVALAVVVLLAGAATLRRRTP